MIGKSAIILRAPIPFGIKTNIPLSCYPSKPSIQGSFIFPNSTSNFKSMYTIRYFFFLVCIEYLGSDTKNTENLAAESSSKVCLTNVSLISQVEQSEITLAKTEIDTSEIPHV